MAQQSVANEALRFSGAFFDQRGLDEPIRDCCRKRLVVYYPYATSGIVSSRDHDPSLFSHFKAIYTPPMPPILTALQL